MPRSNILTPARAPNSRRYATLRHALLSTTALTVIRRAPRPAAMQPTTTTHDTGAAV